MKKILVWLMIITMGIFMLACGTEQEPQSEEETLDEMMSATDDAIDAGESIVNDSPVTFDDVAKEETQEQSAQDIKKEPTVEVHQHQFAEATCTAPRKCSCGATEGSAAGHQWRSATCTAPQTCGICGETSGSANGHRYSDGQCGICGAEDPDYVREEMVWIPTKGGTKYHSRSSCSNMNDPDHVTLSEAQRRGFDACKKCY